MKRYLIDPIYWYFLIFFKDFAQKNFLNQYVFFLNKSNTIPMARNLFIPLYQDQSSTGKSLAFIIRSIWIVYGSIVSTIRIIPNLLVAVFVLMLPFIGIFFILNAFI